MLKNHIRKKIIKIREIKNKKNLQVKARFLNGVPSAIEATYVWKNESDFQRFMRFAKRYASSHGMGYSEK